MPNRSFALCVCSDLKDCTNVSSVLKEFNLEVLHSVGWRNARPALADQQLRLIFCEDCLPDGTYRELLGLLKGRPRRVPVIVSSLKADWDDFLQAMQLGAYDLIRRPYRSLEIKWVAGNALTQRAWPPTSESEVDGAPVEPQGGGEL